MMAFETEAKTCAEQRRESAAALAGGFTAAAAPLVLLCCRGHEYFTAGKRGLEPPSARSAPQPSLRARCPQACQPRCVRRPKACAVLLS